MGFILQHKVSGKLKFYWSSQNNQLLFDKPLTIRNESDKEAFVGKLKDLDLIERIGRPNSAWVLVKVTNIEYFVYKLKGIPIGSAVDLPEYLKRNKGLYSLINRKDNGKPFNDKKCFFPLLSPAHGSSN